MLRALALILVGCFLLPAQAVEDTRHQEGDDDCYRCHKLIKTTYPDSIHGKIFKYNPRTPLEAQGCGTCHGPGTKHAEVAGGLDYTGPSLIEGFKETPENISSLNALCTVCHQGGEILHWSGSGHDINKLACTSCHRLHSREEKVPQQTCERCHVEQRAKLQRSSHLPVREGKLTCTSCHSPHGSSGDASLKFSSINDTCYQCHADKRGPFIWEHAPVRENCANCHDPHGSNHEPTLKRRMPYLCQGCHQTIYHVSELFDGTQVKAKQMAGKSCVNCHAMIHGSNHPSGTMFQR